MCKCKMNKNNLLTLYFHEGTNREEQEIQKHVDGCKDCQAYLLSLEQMDQTLHQWQDEAPLPNTLDVIMAKIPRKQSRPVAVRPTVSIAPILTIVFSVLCILALIFFLHDKIALLPFWQTLKEYWCFRLFGSFGTTTTLFFLFGLFVTLSITPVLILESKSKKYRYYFN